MMNQAMMNQLTLIWLVLLSDYVELNQVNHLVMPVNHLHNHLKLMVQYLIILHLVLDVVEPVDVIEAVDVAEAVDLAEAVDVAEALDVAEAMDDEVEDVDMVESDLHHQAVIMVAQPE